MDETERTLARLRLLWKHAPPEEQYAINVTGKALKNGDTGDTVMRRIAAHERRFSKNKYDV